MPDCTSLEAVYELANITEAVAHAAWAVEQAEADLAYQEAQDATTAKWVAWINWQSCLWGGEPMAMPSSPGQKSRHELVAKLSAAKQTLDELLAKKRQLFEKASK